MISKARIRSGYATKLPAVKGRTFKFEPGLNILFGPNGCGKTTVLKVVGAYSGTAGGWSRFLDPDILRHEKDAKRLPEDFARLAPGGCEATVEWDGTASFLMSPETGAPAFGALDDSQDGLMGMTDVVAELIGKPSEGQSRLIRLNRFLDVRKAVPDLTKLPERHKHVNSTWQRYMEEFAAYTGSLSRSGPATVLLDEVDRSLSIPNQEVLWSKILPKLAETSQVIAATHCPFALLHPSAIVEMADGYVDSCARSLQAIKTLETKPVR